MFPLGKPTKVLAFIMLAGLLSFYLGYRAATQEVYHPTMVDFEKITFDMGEREVEAILGPPHKVLTSKSSKKEFYRPESPDVKVFLYYGPTDENKKFQIYDVKIDADERVFGYGASGSDFEQSVLERIREWLKNIFGL